MYGRPEREMGSDVRGVKYGAPTGEGIQMSRAERQESTGKGMAK